MLTIAGVVGIAAVKTIAMGTAFGIGFWCSRKITGKIDQVLFFRNKSMLNSYMDMV